MTRARACACATWTLAAASAAGALLGLSRHALLVAVGFRALTAWRLGVAGRVLWRRDATRPWTLRLAALGSSAAHVAVAAAALGATLPSPVVHRLCASAARCSPTPWAMLPLGAAGVAHAAWLWRSARADSAWPHSAENTTAQPSVTSESFAGEVETADSTP